FTIEQACKLTPRRLVTITQEGQRQRVVVQHFRRFGLHCSRQKIESFLLFPEQDQNHPKLSKYHWITWPVLQEGAQVCGMEFNIGVRMLQFRMPAHIPCQGLSGLQSQFIDSSFGWYIRCRQ